MPVRRCGEWDLERHLAIIAADGSRPGGELTIGAPNGLEELREICAELILGFPVGDWVKAKHRSPAAEAATTASKLPTAFPSQVVLPRSDIAQDISKNLIPVPAPHATMSKPAHNRTMTVKRCKKQKPGESKDNKTTAQRFRGK
ncbi:MAG: hypothetical protein Q9218_003939 [Villophora microphyllina]